MSKRTPTLYAFCLAASVSLQIFTNVLAAQTIEATVSIVSDSPSIVTGRLAGTVPIQNPRNFSFETSAIGAPGLAQRITEVELFDSTGQPITYRKLMDGEFLADRDIAAWRYKIDLSPMKDRTASAHASWFRGDLGILMTADLLPLNAEAGTVTIRLSDGGREQVVSDNNPSFRDRIIPAGHGWSITPLPNATNGLAISGEWKFTPLEASEMVREIYRAHKDLFRRDVPLSQIILTNPPTPASHGFWEAETRGSTVTIVSSDMPFRSQSLQRLHEQLRHELFHLWIPNGVNLTGKYDWFYEGFALYRSLKLAVELNRIRFEDFLDTLSRAHTIDSAQSQRTSLIQASAGRFTGMNTQVYARGMLVAFLCDLAMLERSKGKRSVENILKDLYAKHAKPAEAADGNAAVIGLLSSNSELIPVVDRYVTGSDKIEWTAELAAAGIEDSDPGSLTTLRVKEKLGGSQKTLLDKLGYNNWRKLSPNSK